jgi:hypothetical protein
MFAPLQLHRAIGRRFVAAFLAAPLPIVWLPPFVSLLPIVTSCIGPTVCYGAGIADPPAPPVADEVLLISTRTVGTSCDAAEMSQKLDCRRLAIDIDGQPTWLAFDWHNLQDPARALRQTVIYVHGNRVSSGYDATEGMAVFSSIVSARVEREPIRYIIWSWPSSQIPGLIKDYQVKAVRTNPVAWQLAWFIDQLPAETPLALMGYSYGARAVSGTMHILGGGSVGSLKLSERLHPDRPPVRVALMAAAFDADWMLPGQMHQRAITQIDRMVVVTNRQDPAMKFFKLSTKISSTDALGLKGMPQVSKLGTAAKRVQHIDVTHEVGRSHVIYDYLADTPKMNQMWQQLLDDYAEPIGETPIPAYAHLKASAIR